MKLDRASGILAHPTSFPARTGSRVIPRRQPTESPLVVLRLGYSQLMPLSPVGYGDSPYSALSAFAGIRS